MGNAESRNAGCQYEPGHVERVFVHGEPLRDAAIPWPERVQAAAPSLEKAALPFYEACRSPKGRSIANFSRTVRDNPPSLLFPSLPPLPRASVGRRLCARARPLESSADGLLLPAPGHLDNISGGLCWAGRAHSFQLHTEV